MTSLPVPPFYGNLPDNRHCLQASAKMVVEVLEPENEVSFAELDRLSGFVSGRYTWPAKLLVSLAAKGFEVVSCEDFDNAKFVESPISYMLEKYGPDIAMDQIKNSDIGQAVEEIKIAMLDNNIKFVRKIPKFDFMEDLVRKGYYLICHVNGAALNDMSGLVGHFVCVYGTRGTEVMLHNPGLPPLQGQVVAKKRFLLAWNSGREGSQGLIGIRKPPSKGS